MTWVLPYLFRQWDAINFNCWTLVCLVFKEQLDIDLPCFSEVSAEDVNSITDTIGENLPRLWEPTNQPGPFVLVLMGRTTAFHHVGVMLNDRDVFHVEKDGCAKVQKLTKLRFAKIALFKYHA